MELERIMNIIQSAFAEKPIIELSKQDKNDMFCQVCQILDVYMSEFVNCKNIWPRQKQYIFQVF